VLPALHDEPAQVALGLGRPGDADPPRGANDLDRDAIVAFMAYNFARFFADAGNEFRTVVAEGDVVVVEHRLSATLPNGRPYVNDYCFVYEVRDGKVLRIREYMDTRAGTSASRRRLAGRTGGTHSGRLPTLSCAAGHRRPGPALPHLPAYPPHR
jgi:ketosteroid isomerase-like protein